MRNRKITINLNNPKKGYEGTPYAFEFKGVAVQQFTTTDEMLSDVGGLANLIPIANQAKTNGARGAYNSEILKWLKNVELPAGVDLYPDPPAAVREKAQKAAMEYSLRPKNEAAAILARVAHFMSIGDMESAAKEMGIKPAEKPAEKKN